MESSEARTESPEALTVWYDGRCAVCRTSRDWVRRRAPHATVRFVDFRESHDEDLPASREELTSAMWVQRVDGETAAAFDGWRMVLMALPNWRWLATLTSVWPLTWMGALTYRLVARWRFRISRLFGANPCETDTCKVRR